MTAQDLADQYLKGWDPTLRLAIADVYEEAGDLVTAALVRAPVVTDVGPESPFEDYTREEVTRYALRVVTWYETSSYEGSGAALVHRLDGAFVACDIGHCSCYGPEVGVKSVHRAEGLTLDQVEAKAGNPENAVGFDEKLYTCVQKMRELVTCTPSTTT